MSQTATSVENLMARLQRLESRNRWSQRAVVGLFLVMAVTSLLGQAAPRPRVVEAREFILRDGEVRERGRIGFQPDGSPAITLRDQTGKERIWVGLTANGSPTLYFTSKNGLMRSVQLAIRDDGTPRFFLTGGLHTPSINLSVEPSGMARVVIVAEETSEPQAPTAQVRVADRAGLAWQPDGSGNLYFRDANGKLRANLVILPDGSPSLRLQDSDEMVRAVFGATSVELPETGTVESRPPSSLMLFDRQGKSIFEAP